jgi:hypothetical protein
VLYIPALGACTPYDILHGPMPTRGQLDEQAQEAAAELGRVHLDFVRHATMR